MRIAIAAVAVAMAVVAVAASVPGGATVPPGPLVEAAGGTGSPPPWHPARTSAAMTIVAAVRLIGSRYAPRGTDSSVVDISRRQKRPATPCGVAGPFNSETQLQPLVEPQPSQT